MEPIEAFGQRDNGHLSPFRRAQRTHYVFQRTSEFFDFYVATSVSIHKLLCSF
jgi:hypothetical protein